MKQTKYFKVETEGIIILIEPNLLNRAAKVVFGIDKDFSRVNPKLVEQHSSRVEFTQSLEDAVAALVEPLLSPNNE